MASSNKKRWTNMEECEAIYRLYPRRVGHLRAVDCIAKALYLISQRDGGDPVRWLTQRVEWYAKSVAGKERKYIPHPSTWFNEGRFDDQEMPKPTWTQPKIFYPTPPEPERGPVLSVEEQKQRAREIRIRIFGPKKGDEIPF